MVPPLEFEKDERQGVWLWRYACFKKIPFFEGLTWGQGVSVCVCVCVCNHGNLRYWYFVQLETA